MDLDRIIFRPGDVNLARSPLRGQIEDETFVLGAFNPGFTRLPNGNLLLMVRVAGGLHRTMILTSLSWLLPVELSPDG